MLLVAGQAVDVLESWVAEEAVGRCDVAGVYTAESQNAAVGTGNLSY